MASASVSEGAGNLGGFNLIGLEDSAAGEEAE
jgi:hypothetical protein